MHLTFQCSKDTGQLPYENRLAAHLKTLEDIVQLVLAQVQAQGVQLCPQRIPPAVLPCTQHHILRLLQQLLA